MKFSCEICNSKMSATKRLKDVKAADEGYFIICIVCRTDNKHHCEARVSTKHGRL